MVSNSDTFRPVPGLSARRDEGWRAQVPALAALAALLTRRAAGVVAIIAARCAARGKAGFVNPEEAQAWRLERDLGRARARVRLPW